MEHDGSPYWWLGSSEMFSLLTRNPHTNDDSPRFGCKRQKPMPYYLLVMMIPRVYTGKLGALVATLSHLTSCQPLRDGKEWARGASNFVVDHHALGVRPLQVEV